MAGLQVRVFGKLRLLNGEREVNFFPTRHVEELLGFLLLHQDVHHSREKLIDVLWPGEDLAKGRANLSTALWRLRTVFRQLALPESEYLKTTREWVAFKATGPFSLDLAKFEACLAKAQEAQDSEKRERWLRAAGDACQGELCEGIYSEWCLIERERVERANLRALGQLMALRIQRRAFDEAAPIGREILERDPLREEAHRAVMYCYWKLGDRARGVRQFQLCARLLQRELHILPMPETISLYRRIIEERIDAARGNGRLPTAERQQLDAAIQRFLDAAADLNAVLEKGDESVEPQPTT